MRDKAAIRAAARAQRRALAEGAAREMSLAAQERILADGAWQKAACTALYMAARGETDTRLLLESAWRSGKRVLLPRTAPAASPDAAGVMRFLPYTRGQALAAGRFGIPEPAPSSPGEEDREWIPDLVIVPGTAFDREGRRIGSGGGYYDRLFARPAMRDAVRVGLAYAFQVADRIPADPWDIRMHAIATEESLIWL